MMKKIITIFVVAFLSVSLTSCMSHIEDTNGDDTSLETINLESKVEQGSYSNISSLSSSASSGDTTYCFSYDDIDYDTIDLSYGKFSGVAKVHCSDMNEGKELILTITSTVNEGNFEIVVVGPDNAIIETVEVNSTVSVTIPSTTKGEYFVVIGGESAKVSIQIVREIN